MIQAYVKVNLIIYLDYCTTKNLPKDDSEEDSLLSRRLRNGCETSNLWKSLKSLDLWDFTTIEGLGMVQNEFFEIFLSSY